MRYACARRGLFYYIIRIGRREGSKTPGETAPTTANDDASARCNYNTLVLGRDDDDVNEVSVRPTFDRARPAYSDKLISRLPYGSCRRRISYAVGPRAR